MGCAAIRRRLSWPAVAAGCVLSLGGCTRLLGIDGQYVASASGEGGEGGGGTVGEDGGQPNGSGGNGGTGGEGIAGSQPGGDGGAPGGGGNPSTGGGDVGAGGGDLGAGGSSGAGGTGAGGEAASGGSGGFGVTCRPGVYTGTFEGQHRPSTAGTALPINVSGTVTALVGGADAGVSGVTLQFVRTTNLPGDGLDATATLALDCQRNSASGMFDYGGFVNIALPPLHAALAGKVDGSFTAPDVLQGGWHEHEIFLPDFAIGKGTWTATWSRP